MSNGAGHPHPQPRPQPSTQVVSADGVTTVVTTPQGFLPVGQHKLQYVDSNIFDGTGAEMVNTLPSRPGSPFHLIDGQVTETSIGKASPRGDLQGALKNVLDAARSGGVDQANIKVGLDILEGSIALDRPYAGFPVLHYTGPEKVKRVQPIFDAAGRKTGGDVAIHQIRSDNHIESDTALLDPSAVQDVAWTVTYTIDVLDGGADDFAPFVMYFDSTFGLPHVAMDATFSPAMSDGHRYVVKLKHAPARYYNLTYSWGWHIHPPRVQVTENALKRVGGRTLVDWETSTFGAAPRSSEQAKVAAIAQIGDLSPEKRMWKALRDARTAAPGVVAQLLEDALKSFDDWSDRTKLPRGVHADPNADVTLFYVNNTIYGDAHHFDWNARGAVFRATLLNGDHFPHGYMNVDFGGARGWENQFESAGGPGASHTFGRVHWWVNAGPIAVPPVAPDGTPGVHKVELHLNFDRPERLALYQFDPMHHDVAVFSIH